MRNEMMQRVREAAPGLARETERLCRHSPFFCELLARLGDEELAALLQPAETAALADATPPWIPDETVNDVEQMMQRLRRCKQRGLAHHIWWELGLHGDIERSTMHLAQWAGGLLQASLTAAELLLRERFGTVEGGRFTVIGLGKLGGLELNLGSDVDLLFIWDAPTGSQSNGHRSVPAKEYYQHLARMLIRLMDENNAFGVCWPVDMRLRPGGDGAPVALSLSATLDHYCNYGQTWERAMLIKARPVAGDTALGEAFVEGIRPFVFRRYLDYTTVQALARMKQRIDAQGHLHQPGVGFDVKRGRGGIREIEFFTQSLQLLHGGRIDALRTQPCMQALARLCEHGIIDEEEHAPLHHAYRQWRRIEHAIQARKGEHTHALPQGYGDYLREMLGIGDGDRLMVELSDSVHRLFDSQFAEIELPAEEQRCNWLALPEQALAERFPLMDEDEVHRIKVALEQIGHHLQRGLLPERSRGQVDRILGYCMELWTRDANAALASESLARLLQNIAGRATWIDLLATHEGVLGWLAGMLSASRYIATQIAENPSWLEWPIEDERGEGRVRHILDAFEQLDPHRLDDDEYLADLGRMIDQVRLTAAVEVASDDDADPLVIGDWLADAADLATRGALRLSLKQFGLPEDFPFVAVAMGKHGCRSMGLVSDLDMVFVLVHDDPGAEGPKGKSWREWSQRVGRRMIQHLTLQPPFGAGFDFDARLRPSGESGVLVTTIQGFRDYQLHEAQTWEHQALCRARPLTGGVDAQGQVADAIDEILRLPRDAEILRHDVLEMRQKMFDHLASKDAGQINLKQDSGGLVDIEFLAQYARLAFGGDRIGTVATLRHLPDAAPPAWKNAADELIDAFLAYRRMENALRVHLWASVGRLPASDSAAEWETLRRHAPVKSVDELRGTMRQVRSIFRALLEAEENKRSST